MATEIFGIDGLPNFLRYGAPLARLRRAGAPLLNGFNATQGTVVSSLRRQIHYVLLLVFSSRPRYFIRT